MDSEVPPKANEAEGRAQRSHARFPATQWSLVLAAGQSGGPQAFEALTALCNSYRDPVYAWFRNRGCSPADADDLTQRFFLRIIEHRPLDRFERQGVPFRAFLKRCLRNLAINEGPHGPILVPLEEEAVQSEIGPDPQATQPDTVFDAHWRDAVLATAMEALKQEAHQRDETERFRVLAPLLGGVDKAEMEIAANALAITRNHANQLLYRLRLRYRELILQEIARTLPEGTDPTAELQSLMGDSAPKRNDA
jgi:RNA polymerase sigma-70 factor (ECF subfamily)